uniref:Epstein-Barr virus induced gene 3 n=3 Tax=Nothobranchius TaxID=28779 RepID=A0A1A8RHK9_9TELE
MFYRGSVMVAFLVFVLGSQALDMLTTTATPKDPPCAPTVSCWCSSYPNTTLCSWPQPSNSTPTRYIATYRERHQHASISHCHLIPPGSSSWPLAAPPASHQLWHCHLPNLKLLTDYIINITAVHSGGSSSYIKNFMLEDIVKPNPPVDVRVSPHNVKNLLVEWSPPPTWPSLDIFPLKYQLLYQWENRGTPKSVNLGPFESTKVELKGLMPGRAYRFQVCAKEMLDLGHCSDWSSPVHITISKTKP